MLYLSYLQLMHQLVHHLYNIHNFHLDFVNHQQTTKTEKKKNETPKRKVLRDDEIKTTQMFAS